MVRASPNKDPSTSPTVEYGDDVYRASTQPADSGVAGSRVAGAGAGAGADDAESARGLRAADGVGALSSRPDTPAADTGGEKKDRWAESWYMPTQGPLASVIEYVWPTAAAGATDAAVGSASASADNVGAAGGGDSGVGVDSSTDSRP